MDKLEKLSVFRGATDKYGNPGKVAAGSVSGVFDWGGNSVRVGPGIPRGDTGSASFYLYVPRGADLRAKDRVQRANGEQYAVIGVARWDQDDPFGGYDFGYKAFQVESMNG